MSPHAETSLNADRKAFVELMRHLKKIDPLRTVIMVQVENEAGNYGSVRDFSPAAQKLFDASVPASLVHALKTKAGTWQQVFGKDADEFFNAWSIASYIGKVAAARFFCKEILPGIACYIGGKHTYQSQYVSVSTAKGTAVLASDNMYLYENLDKHMPIAATLDADSNLRALDRMKQIASSPRLIIPGHDPTVFTRFSAAGDRVAKIE